MGKSLDIKQTVSKYALNYENIIVMEHKKEYTAPSTREDSSTSKTQVVQEDKVAYHTSLTNENLKNFIKDNVHRPVSFQRFYPIY